MYTKVNLFNNVRQLLTAMNTTGSRSLKYSNFTH